MQAERLPALAEIQTGDRRQIATALSLSRSEVELLLKVEKLAAEDS